MGERRVEREGSFGHIVLTSSYVIGLINLLVDILVVSSSAAAVRRATGYNLKEWSMARILNAPLRGLAATFFNVGEAVVFSAIKYAEVLRVSREARLQASGKTDESSKHKD